MKQKNGEGGHSEVLSELKDLSKTTNKVRAKDLVKKDIHKPSLRKSAGKTRKKKGG